MLLMSLTAAVQAREVDLGACLGPAVRAFRASQTLAPYQKCDRVVARLRRGDRVSFSDGQSFVLGERIHFDRFGSAAIWTDANDSGRVIRIPRSVFDLDRMLRYLRGWREFVRAEVPVIQILDPQNESLEYQLVEYIPVQLKIEDLAAWFIRHDDPPENFKGMKWQEIEKLLEELARQFYRVVMVTDGIQAVYTGERWLMLDFNDRNSFLPANYTMDEAFDRGTVWDHSILPSEHLNEVTYQERERRLCTSALMARPPSP